MTATIAIDRDTQHRDTMRLIAAAAAEAKAVASDLRRATREIAKEPTDDAD